jgi:hypothetical protein
MSKKAILIFFVTSLLVGKTHAQINYVKGYVIDINDRRIECEVVDKEWSNNPSQLKYRINTHDNVLVGDVNTLKEFGIDGVLKYVSVQVKIDTSETSLTFRGTNAAPEWKTTTVFLKVLVEGQASLYAYDQEPMRRFFYKTGDSPIEQLVFKEYRMEDGIKANRFYLNQLNGFVKCGDSPARLKNLRYEKNSLINYFQEFNTCSGSPTITYVRKKRNWFNIKLTPGVNYTSLKLSNDRSLQNADYDFSMNFRLGFELNFILPFNKNKWEIFVEPSFHNYNTKGTSNVGSTNVAFKTMEGLIGLRHYFFLKDSKIFLQAGAFSELYASGRAEFGATAISDVELGQKGASFSVGAGYSQKRYSLELRYSSKSVTANYAYWKSSYQNISLIAGFKLFK